ncbi:MAG: adenylate/guanylate cyclase domain-containing protein [Proteobacteria bacterium]|nr:adenylate/guanylate cyclase domain-containing protein [Pseudomonadota bacterium]
MAAQAKGESLLSRLKKASKVLLICLALNGIMVGFLWSYYAQKLGSFGQVFYTLENKLLDMRFVLRGPVKASNKIGVLGLDEKSIQKFGRWPFSRGIYEKAFTNLKKSGVEWIGFDVVWDKPERTLLSDSLEQIKSLKAAALQKNPALAEEAWAKIENLQKAGLADESIARTIKQYEKIVMGYMYYGSDDRDSVASLGQNKFTTLPQMLESAIQAVIMPDGFELGQYSSLKTLAVVGNTEFLSSASPHFGYFNNDLDADSVVRWVSLVKNTDGNLMPSMSLKMAASMTGREIVTVFDRVGVEEIMLVNPDDDKDVIKIPMDPAGEGRVMLNHLGGSMTIPTFSLADAYDDKFTDKERKRLKGISLMMGPTAMAINDMRANPFESTFNGVEHHAATIDNIVSQRFFKRPAEIYRTEIIIVVIIGVVFSLVLSFSSALLSAASAIIIYVAYYQIDKYLWFSKGVWVYMGMPYIQITGLFMAVTLYKYFTEEREKKKVKGAFQHYLSPDVMNQVLEDPTKLKLGGDRRECTVFFSDVRGFTTISEGLPPDKLCELMNDYLSPMTDVVLRSGGVLDKYIGDAIMAFWGAPVDRPDQADVAAQSVLIMMERLEVIRQEFPKKGFPVIDIGCGLNTGMMSVGNMGSAERFAYTVMGDSVNLGARLESITKEYGVRSIVSEYTVAKLQDPKRYLLRELDVIVVKGKRDPVRIFELIHPMILPNETLLKDLIGEFSLGLAAYRDQDWEKAKANFMNALKIRPSDGPATMFLERIADMISLPRIENWDGVHVFKHK